MGLIAAVYLLSLILVSRQIARLSKSSLKWYLDPVVLVSSVWIFGYLLYASPIFTVREAISYEATIYVMLAHTLFFCGAMLPEFFARGARKSRPYQDQDQGDTKHFRLSFRLLLVVALVGLVGVCSITIDGFLTSTVGLGERLIGGALNEVRTETFERAAGQLDQGPLVRLNRFAAAAFVFVGLMLNLKLDYLSRWQRGFLVLLAVISSAMIVFNQVLIRGGRMDVVVLLLAATFAILIAPQSSARAGLIGFVKRHRVAVALLGGALFVGVLYLLGIAFVQGRSGGVSPLFSLSAYHRMSLTPAVESMVVGSPLLETTALSLSYFVAPLTTHSFYFGLPDSAFPGPFWGQYNFQYLTAQVMRFSGFGAEWNFFWYIRGQLWEPLRALGYGTNVWATILRDLAVDFGWFGAMLSMFFFGLAAKWMALKAITGRYPALVVGYSFFAVFLVFTFAVSTFYVPSVFPPFVYAMVLYAFLSARGFMKVKPRQTLRVPAVGRR